MSKHTPRISQCMIVKNEEKNIQRALGWGKDVMWEQIVVDTGSTDRTVELAESMGAKVYHFEWIDDFAAAKNFAISKAAGDWIAFLDADEFMTEEWVRQLLPLLEQLEGGSCYAIRSPWICIDEQENITFGSRHCRFFRNLQGLGYSGAIHETLTLHGKILPAEHMIDTEAKFPVYHTGYQPAEMEEKGKYRRNIRILEKELEKRPRDYNVMGYLGDAYNGETNEEDAIRWYRKAIAGMPAVIEVRDERSAATFTYLMALLCEQKKEAELMEVYEMAVKKIPWVYDCDFIAGKFYLDQKDCAKAIFHLEKALQITEDYGVDAYGTLMVGNIAEVWEQLAWCHYELKNLQASLKYCVTLLQADSRRTRALTLLLKVLQGERSEEIVRFLGNFYNVRQPSDRIFLLKGAILAQADGVLEVLRKECTQQELDFLDQMKVNR